MFKRVGQKARIETEYIHCVPKKLSHFKIVITLEILGQEVYFRCFWNAEKYTYLNIKLLLKTELACQDGDQLYK